MLASCFAPGCLALISLATTSSSQPYWSLQAAWLQLGLYLVPVRPPRLGACLEACDGVLLLLLGQEVESHLQANGLHVILAQCRGHIHVQFQEAAYEVGGEGTLRGQLP